MRSAAPFRRFHRRDEDPPVDIGTIQIALQPIVEVSTGKLVAAEALARFPGADPTPEPAFQRAYASGHGPDLEAACLPHALSRRPDLPDDARLSINLSPYGLAHPAVRSALTGDLQGLIIELTQQSESDPAVLTDTLADLRGRGALIAVDDLSAGCAGLLRLATLRPDIIKLDKSLINGVRDDPDKITIIDALASLARRIGARLLAEGLEQLEDLATLTSLDVDFVQGWAIAPPALELPQVSSEAVSACRTARRDLLKASPPTSTADSRVALSAITAALASADRVDDLDRILARAAATLDIDEITLSAYAESPPLREASAETLTGTRSLHCLADAPLLSRTLLAGDLLEAHTDDPHTDPTARAILAAAHLASVLLVPIHQEKATLAVLEFKHRARRHWTSSDIINARILVEHLKGERGR